MWFVYTMKYYPAIKEDEKNQLLQVVKGVRKEGKGKLYFPRAC